MIAALKDDWQNAPFTPHRDEAVAREEKVVRRVIVEAEFPDLAGFHGFFLEANRLAFPNCPDCGYLIDFGENQETVHESVAKLFYATDMRVTAKAIGQELNTIGGIRLMRCVFYALKWLVAKFLNDLDLPVWYSQAFYIQVEVAWNGIGEWQF